MKSNRENFIKDKKVLLDSQGSYEAKLWVACYLEQRQKNHSLKKIIAELQRKIKNSCSFKELVRRVVSETTTRLVFIIS